MEWWQTLLVAAIPATVTATALIVQSVLSNQREDKRVRRDAKQRRAERRHVQAMARETREHEQALAAAQRNVEDEMAIRALHVELLTAMDEIYYKLQEYKARLQLVTRGYQIWDKPDLSRLIAAHNAVRIGTPTYWTDPRPIDDSVGALVTTHHLAARDIGASNSDLRQLDQYPGLRSLYLARVLSDHDGRADDDSMSVPVSNGP